MPPLPKKLRLQFNIPTLQNTSNQPKSSSTNSLPWRRQKNNKRSLSKPRSKGRRNQNKIFPRCKTISPRFRIRKNRSRLSSKFPRNKTPPRNNLPQKNCRTKTQGNLFRPTNKNHAPKNSNETNSRNQKEKRYE